MTDVTCILIRSSINISGRERVLSVDEEPCELFVVALSSPQETKNKSAPPIMIFLIKLEQIIFISYHLFPVVAFDLKKLHRLN